MIKPKLLGWLVLVYSLFNWGALIGVIGLFTAEAFQSSGQALAVLNGLSLLTLLVGGIGLILHSAWSKWLVLSGAASSLIVMVIAFVLGDVSTLIGGIYAIALLFFFLAGLSVRIVPSEPIASGEAVHVAAAPIANRSKLDLAYGCFFCCGLWSLMVLIYVGVELLGIKVNEGLALVIVYLVLIPLTLASMAGALLGIVFSLTMWRNWPLPVLSVLTVLFVAALLASWMGLIALSEFTLGASIVVYAAVSVFFSVRWFVFGRTLAP